MMSDHFAIIPSVGPLVLGHALVVTRQHSSNVLATLNQMEIDELRSICERCLGWSASRIPEVRLLCFEHGSRCASQKSLCSTNHGHLHLLPLQESEVAAVLNAMGGRPFKISNFQEIDNVLSPLREYIAAFSLVPNQEAISGAVLDACDIPSQYLRKVVADQIGLDHWDWKLNLNAHLLRRTLALGFEINRRADLHGETRSEASTVSL